MGIIFYTSKGELVIEIDGAEQFILFKPTPRVMIWGSRVFVFAGMSSVKRDDGKWYPRATYNEEFAYNLTA